MAELTMQEEGSTPSTPSSGKWKIYPKADGLYLLEDTGRNSRMYDGLVLQSLNIPIGAVGYSGAAPSTGGGGQCVLFREGYVDVIYFTLAVPKGWGGLWFNLESIWISASGSGNMYLGCEARMVIPGTALIGNYIGVYPQVAVSTTPTKISEHLYFPPEGSAANFTFFRIGDNAADTLASNAYLFSLRILMD